ncbi:MAG: ABC transporter ATP-binding protein [Planctomycetota bacterium]
MATILEEPALDATKPRVGRTHVEITGLNKTYPTPNGGKAVIVDGFEVEIGEGEFIAIIGHSGCGKTTVLQMVAGLNPKTFGTISVAGREVSGPGPDRGVVFQAPCLLPWFTTLGNVMLGVDRVYPDASKKDRKELAEYFLDLVGLGDAIHKWPKELSQGMQQRVGIARALALQPKMLLLDEPFGMLDSLTRMELQDILLGLLQRLKITTMMVTHDVDEALYLSDRIVMMTNGPAAKVGQILPIPFERPRDRDSVLGHESYYDLRESLLDFLEEQDEKKGKAAKEPQPGETATFEAINATQTKIEKYQKSQERDRRMQTIDEAGGMLGGMIDADDVRADRQP